MAPSADSTVQHDVYVNLEYGKDWSYSRSKPAQWRRVVFHVADVDEIYEMAIDACILTDLLRVMFLGESGTFTLLTGRGMNYLSPRGFRDIPDGISDD
jgi:hypothetical protein